MYKRVRIKIVRFFINYIAFIHIYVYTKFQYWLHALPNAIICNFNFDMYVSELVTSYLNSKNISHSGQ